MRIDSFSFGEVIVNGICYRSDIIVFLNRVQENWWRKEGHSLCPEDLKTVMSCKVDTLSLAADIQVL